MEKIIKRWCESEQLSIEDATSLLTEYFSIDNRNPTGEQLMALLQMNSVFSPIDWEMIIKRICQKNNWTIISVYSSPSIQGQTRLLYRYLQK